jgi:hypothetical protein
MIKSTGVVKQIQALQIFNENLQNEFKKQILVFETFENNTPIRVEFNNSNIEKLSDVKVNDDVLIEYYITGNYDKDDNTKVYNSLIAKSIKSF